MPLFPYVGQLLSQFTPPLGLEPTDNRALIVREVQSGLPNERIRIARAFENQAFYDLDGERYEQRREAETEFDFVARPHEETGFTQEVIDILCEHMYSPGPTRQAEDKTADQFLQVVYEQCHIDAVMQESERLSTLNDVAAIEVKCTGDPDAPITLHVWGSEEFHAFTSPDDPRVVIAVVTIDRVDQQTRYRLWFDDVVRTFLTDKASSDTTAGGQLARELPPEKNEYGCLPFAFIHYRMPIRRFWTPAIGGFTRKCEASLNQLFSELRELIAKYAKPIGVFVDVGAEFNPEIGAGRFMRLISGLQYSGGDFSAGGRPSAFYLQAQLSIDQCMLYAEKLINQCLEACRVPLSAVRMEQQGVASGVALVAEQAGLLTRARARQPMFRCFETEVAKTILRVAGAFYDRPELVAAAKVLRLMLAWCEPSIPIPDPVRDQLDENELALGISDQVSLVMRRRGMTEAQAMAFLEQVKKRSEWFQQLNPDLTRPGVNPVAQEGQEPQETPPGKEPDDDDKKEDDDV